jgi:hypothetical protein
MIYFFYHTRYPRQEHAFSGNYTIPGSPGNIDDESDEWTRRIKHKKKGKGSIARETSSSDATKSNFVIHAKMYAIGEKYGISSLKSHSLQQFKEDAENYWNRVDFLKGAQEAYTSTVDEDRGMRDAIVDVFCKRPDILDYDQAKSAIRGLSLCYDLLLRAREFTRKRVPYGAEW